MLILLRHSFITYNKLLLIYYYTLLTLL